MPKRRKLVREYELDLKLAESTYERKDNQHHRVDMRNHYDRLCENVERLRGEVFIPKEDSERLITEYTGLINKIRSKIDK